MPSEQSAEVFGIGPTEGIHAKARELLYKHHLSDRVELVCGAAVYLPYPHAAVDAAFMSSTLELFDTSETPQMLAWSKRCTTHSSIVQMWVPVKIVVAEQM